MNSRWMNVTIACLLTALLLHTGEAPSTARADDEENLASLQSSLDRAIELLAAENYEGYIEEFYPVDEYRRLRSGRRLTDEARHLAALPRFQERMLNVYRIARESEPRWSDGGAIARFSINLTAHEEPTEPAVTEEPQTPAIPDVAGWGDDLDQVLASALAALNEEDYESFVEHIFPANEVVHMQSNDGMELLILKLETYPEMVEAMQRDLEQCQSAAGASDGDVAEFTLTEGRRNPQTVKFQLVGGNWRFFDSITPVREAATLVASSAGGDGDDIVTIEMERIGREWRLAGSEDN